MSTTEHKSEIKPIILPIFRALPIGYAFLMLSTLLTRDWQALVLMPILGLITWFSYRLAIKGKVQLSVIVLLSAAVLVVTILSSYGEGIHDISLIAYSCILILASLFLTTRNQFLIGVAIMMAVSWLAFGEQFGWYDPVEVEPGNLGDLVIILTILVLCVVISFKLFDRFRGSLESAQEEIEKSRSLSKAHEKDIVVKTELGELVHDQVKDSLSTLRGLILSDRDQVEEDIAKKILVIERLHDFSIGMNVEVYDYLMDLGSKMGSKMNLNVANDVVMPLDQMLAFALYTHEMFSSNNSFLKNGIQIHIDKHQNWLCQFESNEIILPETPLADIMLRQLHAEVVNNEQRISLSFSIDNFRKA